MARDYAKHRRPKKRRSAPAAGARWLWPLSGILIGVFIASLGYLHNHQPSAQQAEPAEHKPEHLKHEAHPHAMPKAAEPSSEQKMHFDFYTMLPKSSANPPTTPEPAKPKPAAKPLNEAEQNMLNPATTPAQTSSQPAATSSTAETAAKPIEPETKITKPAKNYSILLGAYERFEDADELKAQAIILGFNATTRMATDNGTSLHQVWIGPFHSEQAALKELHRLQHNQFTGKLVSSKP